MTDEQILKALAQNVMRWPLYDPTYAATAFRRVSDDVDIWNPLTSDNDACAVLDKMQSCGWAYDIGTYRHGLRMTTVRFILGETERGLAEASIGGVDGEARRRAICEAALKAVGGWEE